MATPNNTVPHRGRVFQNWKTPTFSFLSFLLKASRVGPVDRVKVHRKVFVLWNRVILDFSVVLFKTWGEKLNNETIIFGFQTFQKVIQRFPTIYMFLHLHLFHFSFFGALSHGDHSDIVLPKKWELHEDYNTRVFKDTSDSKSIKSFIKLWAKWLKRVVKIHMLVSNWERFWKSWSKVNSLKILPYQM